MPIYHVTPPSKCKNRFNTTASSTESPKVVGQYLPQYCQRPSDAKIHGLPILDVSNLALGPVDIPERTPKR